MSTLLVYMLTSTALFAIGLHTLVVRKHLLRKILALNVMGAAIFLFIVAIGFRNRADAPDPVPHAMVLTGIVVAVSITAFALALVRHLHARTGRTELREEEGLE
jgi:multicomponent Na+:H+ antiporter subunit C